MAASLTVPAAASLALIAAFGYALATVGMKSVSDGGLAPGIAIGLAGFAFAFVAEVMLMRRVDLSVVYITIVAAETVMVLSYAAWIGEGLGLRQALGAGLVLAGLVAVTS